MREVSIVLLPAAELPIATTISLSLAKFNLLKAYLRMHVKLGMSVLTFFTISLSVSWSGCKSLASEITKTFEVSIIFPGVDP